MSASLFFAASTAEVGGYISLWKCLVFLLIFLIWVRLLTWTDKDAEAAHLPRVPLNLGFMGGLCLAVALFFLLPTFIVALAVMIVLFGAEIATYLVIRKQKVGLHDLSKQFKEWLAGFAPKKKASAGSKVDVVFTAKDGSTLEPPTGESGQVDRNGFDALQEIFTDPLRRNAERIEVQSGEARYTTRYSVDGMPYEGAPVNKTDGAAAIALLKGTAGLDVNDRRKPQAGTIRATLDGRRRELLIATAGSTAGESLVVDVEPKKRFSQKLDELGFTNEQLAVVQEAIADATGVVLLAAPHRQGLTTLEYAILRAHDAFLTHIQTIERNPDLELEGITQNALPASAPPAEESKQITWVISQEPDVILVSRLEDPKSAIELVKVAGAGKRVYVGLRAGTTFEAIEIWRKAVGDDKLAMKNLKLVIAGRVLRNLCEACKIDYSPDPDTLRRLNLSPDRVSKLFTARTTPLKDSRGNPVICEFCLDLRYKGRTGVFEVFNIDDEVRQTVQQGGSTNQLKMVFKKQKRRYLQETALAKAIAGETSLQEVARVMKGSEGRTGTGTAGPSRSRPPSSGPSNPGPTSGGKSVPPRRTAPPTVN